MYRLPLSCFALKQGRLGMLSGPVGGDTCSVSPRVVSYLASENFEGPWIAREGTSLNPQNAGHGDVVPYI